MTRPAPISPLDDHSLERLADVLEQRRPASATRDKWVERVLLWVVSVLLAWGALQTDVAVLKTRVDTQDNMLREMRQDIKTLLLRVKE